MEYRDYYKTLGVDRNAGADEIKAAYRKLARRYHPDVSKEPDAEARFKEVGEAYEVLRDSEKRAAYDQLGSNWKAGQDFRPPPGWEQQFRGFGGFGGGGGRGGADPFSDFFSELFGGAARAAGAAGARAGAQRAAPPQVQRVTVTPQEAFNGAERQLRLTDSALGQTRTLKVRIPAGVTDGQKIRLAGQGGGGADLHLEVALSADPRFRIEGRDVTSDLPLAPWEAALGATVQVPTLGGTVELRVPAGSQSGARMRLRGRGLGGRDKGDHYCVLKVVLPDASSARARALYEEMARELDFNPRAEAESGR